GATMAFLCPADDSEWGRRRATLAAATTDPEARARVDSGKLAEPYWYTASPLTTGEPPAGFPTAPGQVRPPVAGVLCPDGQIRTEAPPATRLRELFGDGFVLLAGSGVDDAALDTGPGRAPVTAYRLDEIDHDGVVTAALAVTPRTLAVVRP